MEHRISVLELGDGLVRAVCVCGWTGEVQGADKEQGTMDALQHARDSGDMHQWETSLGEE